MKNTTAQGFDSVIKKIDQKASSEKVEAIEKKQKSFEADATRRI